MDDPKRKAYRAVELAMEQILNRERKAFAERVVSAFQGIVQGEEFTPTQYQMFMRRLDAVFAEFYGEYPGDRRARFYRATLLITQLARKAAMEEDRRYTEALVEKYSKALRKVFDA